MRILTLWQSAALFTVMSVAAAQEPSTTPPKAPPADRRVVGTLPDYHNNKAPAALGDSSNSLANLDTIRDRNLHRAQKGGCPPEVSARIADLKWKLGTLNPRAPGSPAQSASAMGGPRPASHATIASEWFQAPPSEAAADTKETLDSVLPVSLASPPKPVQKTDSRDAEQIRAEIKTLEAACVARN